MRAEPGKKPPPRRRAGGGRRAAGARYALGALAAALLGIGLGGPYAMVEAGTRRARACFAAADAPRGPELPDCRRELRWFALPSHLPWTAQKASYRAEELEVRAARAATVDAAVGRPDAAALERAEAGLERAEATVAAGSARLSFEELGPSVGAPHPGRAAAELGDRRALLARPDRWPDWYVRVATLRAALLEGDLDRAFAIAERYADFDPRDDDLRTTVSAVLCLGRDPKRGLDMLSLIMHDRASRRYEAMARNWGDVRALMLACAARAGVPPPAKPASPDAGTDDAIELRVVAQVGVAARRGDAAEVRRAASAAKELLAGPARAAFARGALLAVVLAHGERLRPADVADLARARLDDGEAPLRLGSPLAYDWFPGPRLAVPWLPAAALARAAERAIELAAGLGAEGAVRRPGAPNGAPGFGAEGAVRRPGAPNVDPKGALAPEQRDTLLAAAAALGVEAAREHALAGDASAAIDALDRFAALSPEGTPAVLAMARASAWRLAFAPERALAALDAGAAPDAPPAAAAALLARAELLALLGRRGEAGDAVVRADDLVAEAGGAPPPPAAAAPEEGPPLRRFPWLDVRARWTRLALARPLDAALRPGGPPPPPDAGAPGSSAHPFPWVGFANADAPWARLDQPALALSLAGWHAARRASPETRRALRYAALGRRSDAPPALVAYLSVASELLGEGEGDVETWLDALLAMDGRRFAVRHLALARAEAALWRGDAAAAATWRRRYEALRAASTDPARAEIARFLGI